MHFRNRREAGQQLAKALSYLRGTKDTVVLGIPRGGVVVAYEVATALDVPLDVYIARKIGAPYNPELAIGAVTSDGTVWIDEMLAQHVGADRDYIDAEVKRQRDEIERRMNVYHPEGEIVPLENQRVVLVDDGIATGATVLVSLRALRKREPKELILAVPVGPVETIAMLENECDRVVCLHAATLFWAVGAFYDDFDQTSDREVVQLLESARKRQKPCGESAPS
ncbi:MAG: phosphoribosyltransferase [Chloroflexi bacterium]|nr:phosphoribosyltransferase [Chloroflexota bacterium]